ncbi:hypothetical protein QZM12_26480, partial [Burkholderia cepacia]|nr:hypothetical protein [Burkholderia cepacia]MDN7636949.1 hypothetical protein [Burkholderia cepacia]
SEIMNRVSQLVNNFLHYIVATAGFNFQASRAPDTAAHHQLCFLFRTAFPLARKRRDSKHPLPTAQGV